MTSPISPYKGDANALLTLFRPENREAKPVEVLPTAAASLPTALPPEDGGTDDFLYDKAGRLKAENAFNSVLIPGVGLVGGLDSKQTYIYNNNGSPSTIGYQVKVEGVIVAIIDESGGSITTVPDVNAKTGIGSSAEDGLSGAEAAEYRVKELARYLVDLGVVVEVSSNQSKVEYDGTKNFDTTAWYGKVEE